MKKALNIYFVLSLSEATTTTTTPTTLRARQLHNQPFILSHLPLKLVISLLEHTHLIYRVGHRSVGRVTRDGLHIDKQCLELTKEITVINDQYASQVTKDASTGAHTVNVIVH